MHASLAATHEGDDFESISFSEFAIGVVPSRDQFTIAFDSQVSRFEFQLVNQPGDRRPGLHLARLFVYVDLHVEEECTGGSGRQSRKRIRDEGDHSDGELWDWHGKGSGLCYKMGSPGGER